ncbi:hypothetical protein GCM10025859_17800 [Alicyclobacillus fastidiosus]|nr:hypothetical protein GCM10025859_17800 [Alicyclobacillus fastidiosus]
MRFCRIRPFVQEANPAENQPGIIGRVGADYDLSIIQIRLLGILRDREPSMLQLAKYLNLDKSALQV